MSMWLYQIDAQNWSPQRYRLGILMGDVVSYIDLYRASQRGRCGSSGFLPHPPEPEQSLAVMTDRRGECDDPAAASGPLHTLNGGRRF